MTPLTYTTDNLPAFLQKTTPVKARIHGECDFLESEGLKISKEKVFRYNSVSRATGYRIPRSSNPRTLKNDLTRKKTRGRRSLISPREIHEMEQILENEGLEGRALTWQQLRFEVELDLSEVTIQRTMGIIDYHKCLAYQRGWQSPKRVANRVKYAKVMLERHSESGDRDHIRFSDEVHFEWGAKHQLHIIRKPGQQYCIDCIQHREEPKSKDERRFHC